MAELKLVVVDGPNQGTEFDISGAAVIGRDPSSGIVLDDPESSRRHASVSVEGETLTVEDLGSTNGTFVSGERITGSRQVNSGDRIRIGTTVLEVRAEMQATSIASVPDTPDPQATSIASVPSEPPAPEPEPEQPVAAEPPAAPEPPAPEPSMEPAGPPEPPSMEPPAPPEPPTAPEPPEMEPAGPPEPPAMPEPPAAAEPPTAPEPPAEPEPDDAGTLAPEPTAPDEGATALRPTPSMSNEPPADEGATALRPLPGDMAPPPGGGPGGPPAPEPGPPTEPHYAEGPQASAPPPPPPPGGYSGAPGAPPPPPAFGGGPPPPPPGGGFGGPEAGGPPPPPPPGGPGFAPPPQAPPGYAGAPPSGGPLAPPPGGGFAPQGPMPIRNSVVEWLLSYFVPFYNLYWFHRSNKEMQAWSQGRIDYNATSSLLALTLGAIVIVPVFIAWSSYIGRVREAQRMAGLPQTANFWGSVGRAFLLLYSVKWHQDQFNEIGQRPPQY